MGLGELLLLALGVSMDAFAVSICKGLAMKKATIKEGLTCGIWFGGFQALMPLIGFFLGTLFASAIQAIDHWVAFVLLGFISNAKLSAMRIFLPSPTRKRRSPRQKSSQLCFRSFSSLATST